MQLGPPWIPRPHESRAAEALSSKGQFGLLIRWSLARFQPGEPVKSRIYPDNRPTKIPADPPSLHHGCTRETVSAEPTGVIDFLAILGPDGSPLVRQQLRPPAVYLDTWALRHLGESDAAAAARFRTALPAAGGTLVLSDWILNDFTGFDDDKHARAAGRFIDTR
jgi:hypothetical protein